MVGWVVVGRVWLGWWCLLIENNFLTKFPVMNKNYRFNEGPKI